MRKRERGGEERERGREREREGGRERERERGREGEREGGREGGRERETFPVKVTLTTFGNFKYK